MQYCCDSVKDQLSGSHLLSKNENYLLPENVRAWDLKASLNIAVESLSLSTQMQILQTKYISCCGIKHLEDEQQHISHIMMPMMHVT